MSRRPEVKRGEAAYARLDESEGRSTQSGRSGPWQAGPVFGKMTFASGSQLQFGGIAGYILLSIPYLYFRMGYCLQVTAT